MIKQACLNANLFLGILVTRTSVVTRTSAGFYLSQQKYATEILNKTGMSQCKHVSAPVATSRKLFTDAGSPYDDPTLYRSLASTLQYLIFTRPDISYVVQQVCL